MYFFLQKKMGGLGGLGGLGGMGDLRGLLNLLSSNILGNRLYCLTNLIAER